MAALQKMFRLYTGASMPAVGLGTCTPAGRPAPYASRAVANAAQSRFFARFAHPPGKAEPHQVAGAVRAALEAGYRHIDGAAICTWPPCVTHCSCIQAHPAARQWLRPGVTGADGNEAEVGQVYKEVFGTGKRRREDVFICSKLWNSSHHPERVPKALSKTLSVRVRQQVVRRPCPC